MKRNSLDRYIVIICILLGLVYASGSGCHTETRRSSHIPAQKSLPKKETSLSFAFGAVHSTFADIYARPSMNSERLTQCVYGDVVRIESEKDWWYAVKVGPYPELEGWIHKTVITPLTSNMLYLKERHLATIVIRQDKSEVFVWPGQTFDIVMGTELPFLGESGKWYLVRLPSNDVGRIERDAVYPTAALQPDAVPPSTAVLQPAATLHALVQPLIHSKQEPAPKPQDVPKRRKDIIITARKFLGKVYIWGGTTPRGFDCSGLSYFVYKLNGIELPRVSWLQYRTGRGKKVKKSKLNPGDLVFFETYRPGPSHVGIYIGNNQFIHASPNSGVTTSSLDEPYFKKRYIGAKTLFSDISEG
jgi:hypothetical protein